MVMEKTLAVGRHNVYVYNNNRTNSTIGSTFTPTADITINALHFSIGNINAGAVSPRIYNKATGVLVAKGASITRSWNTTDLVKFPLDSPVTLKAGTTYTFAYYCANFTVVSVEYEGRTVVLPDDGVGLSTPNPPTALLYQVGDVNPSGILGNNANIITTVTALVPEPSKLEKLTGYLDSSTTAFSPTYRVTNPDNVANSVVVTLDGSTISTLNTPTHNAVQTVNLAPYWESLVLGSHELQVTLTSAIGENQSFKHRFTKIIATTASILESVGALAPTIADIKGKRSTLAAFFGLDETATFSRIVDELEAGNAVVRRAEGSLQLNDSQIVTVTGLAFRPQLVVIAFVGYYGGAVAQGVHIISDRDRFYNNINSLAPPKERNLFHGGWKAGNGPLSGTLSRDPATMLKDGGFTFTTQDVYNVPNTNYNFRTVDWLALG